MKLTGEEIVFECLKRENVDTVFGYPGGPMIEKMASVGDENRFVLPRPLHNSGDCNLSFSGLKTAVPETLSTMTVVLLV